MKIQTEPFRKIAAATAAEICSRVELSKEALSYLLPTLSPQGFLSLLIEAECVGDAVRFVAFALPVREAVWLACVVAHSNLAERTPLEASCLDHAAAWVYEPTDERRRACFAVAEEARFEGAAAYAALAAFWSGGSLAAEGMPEVPADPQLGPIGAGASILLAITRGHPASLQTRFETVMMRATDIANGGNGWLNGDRPLKNGKLA